MVLTVVGLAPAVGLHVTVALVTAACCDADSPSLSDCTHPLSTPHLLLPCRSPIASAVLSSIPPSGKMPLIRHHGVILFDDKPTTAETKAEI